MSEPPKPAKPRGYRFGAALIWAGTLGGIPWLAGEGFWAALGSGIAGFLTGWSTASLLGWFARFQASRRTMAIAGLVLGLLVSSGAVTGLKVVFTVLRPGAAEFDWSALAKFLLSWSAVPAAILGVVTGLYVRSKFQPPEEIRCEVSPSE